MQSIVATDYAIFHIRRIPNNHIKPAILENSIKLDKPMEGLVGFQPVVEGGFVTDLHPVFPSQMAVEFIF